MKTDWFIGDPQRSKFSVSCHRRRLRHASVIASKNGMARLLDLQHSLESPLVLVYEHCSRLPVQLLRTSTSFPALAKGHQPAAGPRRLAVAVDRCALLAVGDVSPCFTRRRIWVWSGNKVHFEELLLDAVSAARKNERTRLSAAALRRYIAARLRQAKVEMSADGEQPRQTPTPLQSGSSAPLNGRRWTRINNRSDGMGIVVPSRIRSTSSSQSSTTGRLI